MDRKTIYQIGSILKVGPLHLLATGDGRYTGISFSPSGTQYSYTSTVRNGTDWDLYIRSLGGEPELIQSDEGIGWAIGDWNLDETSVIAFQYISAAEGRLYTIDLKEGSRTQHLTEHGKISISGGTFGPENSQIFFVSDLDSEFEHLFELNTENGEVTDLTPDLEWNVTGVAISPDRTQLIYAINDGGLSKLYGFTTQDKQPISLPDLPTGRVSGMTFSPDGTQMAFSFGTPTSLYDVYVLEIGSGELTRWTQSEMGPIDRSGLVSADLIQYESFDGRTIPTFVYQPEGDGPHPVLIYIHGGPEAQYRPGFSSLFQYLQLELGIATVAPNVRGSDGYGKTYLTLDNGMLREDSVKDIGALLDWIGTVDHLDENRVVVYGGSYGGYMVLASMVHYSDRLRGGIETVGISNFVTFLENTMSYRRNLRRVEYGDETDPEMRAFLESIAPLNHVEKITKPLLIAQGLNDPRVPASESEQIVAALEQNEIPVWYILAEDEGHGFAKKSNRDYFTQAISLFLQTHLLTE